MRHLEIHRAEHPEWLSNAYLVVDRAERRGLLIDGNGVGAPLLERIAAEDVAIDAILLTHHHIDHVEIDAYRSLGALVYGHPATAGLAGRERLVDRTLADGQVLELAGMRIEALHTPGHAGDHVAYLVGERDCFTADVLFNGTVGGTRASGATGLDDLRSSIARLLALPPETALHPGHGEPTTVARERAENPFVRAWAGEPPAGEPCTVGGMPARLLLWGPDYDGTHKAWVRLGDGTEHVVGGSQARRA